MDSLIPWQAVGSIISPIFYERKVGHKSYPVELMLRIHIYAVYISDLICYQNRR